MKKKLKAAVSDPIFIRICVLFAVMAALGVTAALLFGNKRFTYVLQAIYVVYVPLLFFTVRDIIRLYIRYFREKKEKKPSKLKNKLKTFFRRVEDKVRTFFDLKPKYAYFGGEDESVDAEDVTGREKKSRKRADTRIAWTSIHKNEEKIRFLYAKRINAGIDAGAAIAPSDTARQAKEKVECDERDEVLFDLYESVRYTDHNVSVSDGTIGYLNEKKHMDKNKKKKKRSRQ